MKAEDQHATENPRTTQPQIAENKPAQSDERPTEGDRRPDRDPDRRSEDPAAPDAPEPQRTVPAMKGLHRQDPVDEIDRVDATPEP